MRKSPFAFGQKIVIALAIAGIIAPAKLLSSPTGGAAGPDESGRAVELQRAERTGKSPDRPKPDFENVSYGPHERQVFDLWRAKSVRPAPLVVFIHGGGFNGGDKSSLASGELKAFLAEGISCAAINYRLLREAPIQEILRDCARAVQFLRAHAEEYRVDPSRVAAQGSSAGAGASLWLAFHPDLAEPGHVDPVRRESSRLVAAAATNPQATYDLLSWENVLGESGAAWTREGEVLAFYRCPSAAELDAPRYRAIRADVDLLGLISADDPPVALCTTAPGGPATKRSHFLHHPRHALALQQQCEADGVPVVLLRRNGAGGKGEEEALRRFLVTQLKGELRAPGASAASAPP